MSIDEILKIKPSFTFPNLLGAGFEHYTHAIEESLKTLLPALIPVSYKEQPDQFFKSIFENLPLIAWTHNDEAPYILSITCLAPAQNTHGLGRFIADHSSRWLLPGKQLALVHVNSLAFNFEQRPDRLLFFHQQLIRIETIEDFKTIRSHLPFFTKQLKINILTVIHSRQVASQKSLTLDERKMIIQENIAYLVGKSLREIDRSIFDYVNQFVIKILAEEKVNQIKESLTPLLEIRPKIFDRAVFNEVQEQIATFKDQFIAFRDLRHLTRMISYDYFFRKNLLYQSSQHPNQRNISFKVMRTTLSTMDQVKPVLAVIVGLNLLRENEIFEERHLYKSLQACLPGLSKIKGSFFEHRADRFIRTFYLEVEKKDHTPFKSPEITKVKKTLLAEIKTRIESVYSPVFMPKNEEEVLKNVRVLSQELKYVQDIPQVYISFHKQTDDELFFTAIILRLIKPLDLTIKTLIAQNCPTMKVDDLESKVVGTLRKRYPKEATVCDIRLEKKQFLRMDFSLDLYEARRTVVSQLEKVFGNIRDYNGGMISKQNEALSEFRKLLFQANIHNDFLVENYFYSVSPSYMQSILPSTILKHQFKILLQALEQNYHISDFFLKTQVVGQYFIVLIAASNITFKDFIEEKVDQLESISSALTVASINYQEIFSLGYIYNYEAPSDYQLLLETITESLLFWQSTFQTTLQTSEAEPSLVAALLG